MRLLRFVRFHVIRRRQRVAGEHPVEAEALHLDSLGIRDIDYLSFDFYSLSLRPLYPFVLYDEDFPPLHRLADLIGLRIVLQDVSGDRLDAVAGMHRLEELDLDMSTPTSR